MAYTGYGAKYTLTFSDVFQDTKDQYIATIYRKGYSGAVVEIDGGSSPLVIETDSTGGNGGYRPIIATKASLNLVIADVRVEDEWEDNTNIWELYNLILGYTGFDFTEFITAESDTFLLEVKKKAGGSYNIIWQGYYIYNTDVSLNEIMPIQFSLQFSDVLQMKSNRFYNFTSADTNLIKFNASDYVSIEEVIMKCCYFAKITDSVVLEFPYPTSSGYKKLNAITEYVATSLSGMMIQKNAFLQELGKYNTLYEVLEGICSEFGLIAYFKNNKLHIKSYQNLINQTTRFVNEYTISSYNSTTDVVSYSNVSNYYENDSAVALNSSVFKNIGRDQTIRFNYPIESVVVKNKAAFTFNTPNYTMSSVSNLSGGNTGVLNSWYSTFGGYFPEGIEHRFSTTDNIPNTYSMPAYPFYPYCTLKTDTYGSKFATKFVGKAASGFNIGYYIDSEPFTVSPGDTFAFSYSALTDGRLKNLPTSGGGYTQSNARPIPVVALILIIRDEETNTDVIYYYNSSTNKFESGNTPTGAGSLPLVTTTNYIDDSDRISYNLKGVLDIPENATIKIRQYQPYRTSGYSSAPDSVQLYVEYCNLQTFKGTNISGLPTNQSYSATFGDIINSDESISLDSNIFMMDATKYVPVVTNLSEGKSKNPVYIPTCYSNSILDRFYNPVAGLFFRYDDIFCTQLSYSPLQDILTDVTSNIIKNVGLNNVTIEGSFKSVADYYIGSKFSYQIIGYDSVTFVLLDYTIDFKNGTYNALLYSSEFTDATGKTIDTKTIIS
jgi:hypothetical protein